MLTVVRASVDALGGATANSELSAIEDATARGAQLTRRLLSLSRREGLTLVKQPLGPVLHETKHDLESVLPSHVRLKIPDEVLDTPLQLDRDSVKHVVLLTSGFAVESVDDVLRESNVEFLAKPWASHALVSALDRLMASSTSPRAAAEDEG